MALYVGCEDWIAICIQVGSCLVISKDQPYQLKSSTAESSSVQTTLVVNLRFMSVQLVHQYTQGKQVSPFAHPWAFHQRSRLSRLVATGLVMMSLFFELPVLDQNSICSEFRCFGNT